MDAKQKYVKPRRQTPQKRRPDQLLLEWAVVLLAALLLALVLTQVVFVNALVPSESMEDVILTGNRIIGFRMAYWFGAPKRGDIAIFKYPDDETQLYIKRVIGLPGDVVSIKDGRVYINGAAKALSEPYVKGAPSGNFGPYAVPGGSYFMLGDNRNKSWDARYWNNTFVAQNKILGRAIFRIYPNFTWL